MSAFLSSNKLSTVYYSGTAEQWKAITIGDYNEPLLSANIHYNSAGPDTTMSSKSAEIDSGRGLISAAFFRIQDEVKYVSYFYPIPINNSSKSNDIQFTLIDDTLPSGLVLRGNGELYGDPLTTGYVSLFYHGLWGRQRIKNGD